MTPTSLIHTRGRAILDAIVTGEQGPECPTDVAQGRLKAKHDRLVEALRGVVFDHHGFLIRLHLQQIDALQQAVLDVETRLGEALLPFRDAALSLAAIPGSAE